MDGDLARTSRKRKRRQVKAACLNCRRSKTACEDQRPCSRCRTRGWDCTDAPMTAKTRRASGPEVALPAVAGRSGRSSSQPHFASSPHAEQLQQSERHGFASPPPGLDGLRTFGAGRRLSESSLASTESGNTTDLSVASAMSSPAPSATGSRNNSPCAEGYSEAPVHRMGQHITSLRHHNAAIGRQNRALQRDMQVMQQQALVGDYYTLAQLSTSNVAKSLWNAHNVHLMAYNDAFVLFSQRPRSLLHPAVGFTYANIYQAHRLAKCKRAVGLFTSRDGSRLSTMVQLWNVNGREVPFKSIIRSIPDENGEVVRLLVYSSPAAGYEPGMEFEANVIEWSSLHSTTPAPSSSTTDYPGAPSASLDSEMASKRRVSDSELGGDIAMELHFSKSLAENELGPPGNGNSNCVAVAACYSTARTSPQKHSHREQYLHSKTSASSPPSPLGFSSCSGEEYSPMGSPLPSLGSRYGLVEVGQVVQDNTSSLSRGWVQGEV